ncbi:MAG: SpoIIE family protein phosphatase, partial [Anaerotignum sp.]|nr:SpoIIE family protein phosphatase [Anaerotignum sp.]
YQDIMDASDENLLNKMREIRKNYLAGVDVDTLAEQYNVIEVNIIDADGFIRFTNYAAYQDYDMASGEQSAEFLVLLDGEKESYIQDYRPTSYDNETYRKYGGLTLPDGGFLQVGYDATQFGDDIDAFVGKVTKNRHIGKQGFIIICDEQFRIVTEDSQELGKELKSVGISVDLEKMPSNEIFEVDLNSVPHLCTYRFVEGYYIIGMMPVEEAMFMKTLSVYVNVFMQIIIFAALFVLIYFLIKKIIIDNLRKINGTLAQITNGNLDVTVEVRSNEEFASLSDDINSTVTTLKQYIAEAAARIDQELEFAKQIQYSSLPVTFPDRCEIELYAKMRTAKEVGGDFYDFYMLNDHVVAFIIADVSGKGIPAAMFMMKAKTIIKDLAESGLEPDEIFTKANEKLCENNDASMFVTAWLGILDLATGLLKFANAGHNPPLLCKRGEDFAYLKNRSGLFLAGMEGIRYRKNELQMEPGDRIYLYTDGVTEATNKSNKLYGEEKLLELTNDLRAVAPKEFCKMIEEDVDRFVGDAPQFDDITMLCLSLNCLMAENEIVVLCKEDSLEAVKRFEEKLVSKLMAAPKVANRIHIIFDEIYANILHYSNAKTITIRYQIKDEKLQLTFLDDGIPYDPLNTAAPDITLSAEEREIGGLGILIVKNMSESMEYVYKDNKNILNLTISLF